MSKKEKLTIPISRGKVKTIRKQYRITETLLCKMLDISIQQYSNRFRTESWNYESSYALCFVLMSITKKTINPLNLCEAENVKEK